MARKTTKKKTDARRPPKRESTTRKSVKKAVPIKKTKSQSTKRYIRLEEATVHEIYNRHAAKRTTDGFAIASFVCGLLGFLIPFLNIAAIVLGIVAIHSIHKNQRQKGHGLAVIGMLLGFASLLLVLIADVVSLSFL